MKANKVTYETLGKKYTKYTTMSEIAVRRILLDITKTAHITEIKEVEVDENVFKDNQL